MTIKQLRTIIGMILAPGLPFFTMAWINSIFFSKNDFMLLGTILFICAYLAAFFVGVPTYLFLEKRGIRSFYSYVYAGALIGVVFYFSYCIMEIVFGHEQYFYHLTRLIQKSYRYGVTAIIYSIVASALFWIISIKEYATLPERQN